MLPLSNGHILIITRFQGWFRYDGQTFQEYPTQADEFVKSSLIIHAIMLPGNKIALATQRRGLGLLDLQGNLLQVIDKSSGLRDKILNYVYLDKQDGLWLALSNGIARVEFPSPISRFTEIHGLEGAIFDVIRFQGNLYAATNIGVFRFEARSESLPRFQQVKGITNTAYSFLDHAGKLLIGTHLGLYVMEENQAEITDFVMESNRLNASVICLRSSSHDRQRIYIGTYQGLYLLEQQQSGSNNFRPAPGFQEYVFEVLEDESGGLWVGRKPSASIGWIVSLGIRTFCAASGYRRHSYNLSRQERSILVRWY
jgi:ligand-binding sensor domain-containing protein